MATTISISPFVDDIKLGRYCLRLLDFAVLIDYVGTGKASQGMYLGIIANRYRRTA